MRPPVPFTIGAYRPEYCQQLVDWMREGKSLESFAASINVCRRTASNWRKRFPEWDAAVVLGQTAYTGRLQDIMSDHVVTPQGVYFNHKAAAFLLSNVGMTQNRETRPYTPEESEVQETGGTILVSRDRLADLPDGWLAYLAGEGERPGGEMPGPDLGSGGGEPLPGNVSSDAGE